MYVCMYWNTFSHSVIFFHSLNNVFDEHVLNFNQANLNIFSLYLLILCPIFIQIFCPKLKYTIHLQQIYVYCKWGPNRFKDGKFSGLYSFCISRTAYLSNSKKLKKKKNKKKSRETDVLATSVKVWRFSSMYWRNLLVDII